MQDGIMQMDPLYYLVLFCNFRVVNDGSPKPRVIMVIYYIWTLEKSVVSPARAYLIFL